MMEKLLLQLLRYYSTALQMCYYCTTPAALFLATVSLLYYCKTYSTIL